MFLRKAKTIIDMVFKKYFFGVNLQHLYSITDVSAFVGVVVILYVLYCTVHILYSTVLYTVQTAEVGTRYFFRSPLPLVRYLEIVLPLRAGPQLLKIW